MLKRRLIHLNLARGEWEAIARELDGLPEMIDSCRPAIAALRLQLAARPGSPGGMLTLSQPALYWSPLIFALSFHVLYRPTLLPIAERLRNQMEAQAKGIEGTVRVEDPEEARRWEAAPSESCREMVTAN